MLCYLYERNTEEDYLSFVNSLENNQKPSDEETLEHLSQCPTYIVYGVWCPLIPSP